MINIDTKFILAGRFIFEPNSNTLIDKNNDNETTRLGSNESRILLMLSERPNEVISRHELHEFVWRDQGFEVDDSSLTQAISTLRKMLKDSTKSPQFVKTVPKRGYQLICHVERSVPTRPEPVENSPSSDKAENVLNIASAVPAGETEQTSYSDIEPSTNKLSLLAKILLLIAVILPIGVILMTEPPESQFRLLATYENIPVQTPANHPDLSHWLPSIEQCINKYNHFNQDNEKPIQVIATGGQNNYLILNYIYSMQHSNDNTTVRIFSNQQDLGQVCR